MADRWLTFDCYGTVADWNSCMGGALEAIREVSVADAGRLLTAYHQTELELEAASQWRPYREVLTAGLARAAEREQVALPPGRRGSAGPGLGRYGRSSPTPVRPWPRCGTGAGGWRS